MSQHKDYYKINEIARLYDLHPDTLRYYEEQGLISPSRGPNGYRMYGIRDICILNIVQNLRMLDVPIARISDYLKGMTVDSTLSLLAEEESIVDRRVNHLLALKRDVARRAARIKATGRLKIGAFDILSLPPRPCFTLSEGVTLEGDIDYLLKKLERRHESYLRIVGHRELGATLDKGWLDKGVYNRFSRVFVLAEEGEAADQVIDGGLYASTVYGGDYAGLGPALRRLFSWAAQKGYAVTGTPMELYHIDIHDSRLREEFLTEVQVKIDKAQHLNL